jgi:hypothetical protein
MDRKRHASRPSAGTHQLGSLERDHGAFALLHTLVAGEEVN